MDIDYRDLKKEDFENIKYKFEYTTSGYYDFKIVENKTFEIKYRKFKTEINKCFESSLFASYLENSTAIGAFIADKLIGFIEYTNETWNNRLRITNILVFEPYRNKKIGSKLFEIVYQRAKAASSRMIVLETQSCNEKAISFYFNLGFNVIGFDLYSYSNRDLDNKEVRIELGKIIAV